MTTSDSFGGTIVNVAADYSKAFERVRAEWEAIAFEPDPVPVWESEIARLQSNVNDLKTRGLWRSGRKTLLGALGIHHDEVLMCRGLAWLLTPDGWHGLGSTVLDGLLDRLGVDSDGSGSAMVVVEEPRADTRADIVVRFGATTVLMEAKVWASEQPRQCDRLAEHWSDETPQLVFLTRGGIEPTTAIESRQAWHSIAWSDIADIIGDAVARAEMPEPGVHEYLKTVRIYGGSRA